MDEPKQFLATDPDLYEHFMGRWSVGLADPFRGTTIIAAEMTGRSCHAIEISSAYIDVAVNSFTV
jgi:hypothetical protein